jgi:hypothetical protein
LQKESIGKVDSKCIHQLKFFQNAVKKVFESSKLSSISLEDQIAGGDYDKMLIDRMLIGLPTEIRMDNFVLLSKEREPVFRLQRKTKSRVSEALAELEEIERKKCEGIYCTIDCFYQFFHQFFQRNLTSRSRLHIMLKSLGLFSS